MFSPFVKFISALVSALSISLYWSIKSFTPVSERMDNVAYYSSSFWYGFTIVLLINLAIFLILVMPLSILADGMVISSVRTHTGKRLILLIIAYFIMGLISGMIFALFTQTMWNIKNLVMLFVIATSTYLIWQFLINWLLTKVRR